MLLSMDDVYRMDNIKRNTQKMHPSAALLARNESTTATKNTLKNDVKEIDNEDIDIETINTYLDIFSRLFITEKPASVFS
jgi:predicted AAA+ superfamily ATPase